MNYLKVFELDFDESYILENDLLDMEKYYVEITPKFNRSGKYYNRYEEIEWIEFKDLHGNYRAFIINDTKKYIQFQLRVLNHKWLSNKEKEYILGLLKYNFDSDLNKKLNDILYIQKHIDEIKKLKHSTMKLYKNIKQRGDNNEIRCN